MLQLLSVCSTNYKVCILWRYCMACLSAATVWFRQEATFLSKFWRGLSDHHNHCHLRFNVHFPSESALASSPWIPSSICSATEPMGISGTDFVQADCPSHHPTNSVKALTETLWSCRERLPEQVSKLPFHCIIGCFQDLSVYPSVSHSPLHYSMALGSISDLTSNENRDSVSRLVTIPIVSSKLPNDNTNQPDTTQCGIKC